MVGGLTDRKFWRFMEMAEEMDSRQLMREAAKLGISSNVDVQNMIQQKAHDEKKGATQASLQGDLPETGQYGRGSREGQVQTEQGPQGETRLPAGPGGQPSVIGVQGEEEGYESSLDALMNAPQEMIGGEGGGEVGPSNRINIANQPDVWKYLKMLPREDRAMVIGKMESEPEKFYTSDALKEVEKYLKSEKAIKETIAGEERKEREVERTESAAHKREVGAVAAEEEIGTLPLTGRLAQEQQYTQNLFTGNIEVVDETGNVVDIEPNKAMDLGYSIRRRKPNVSVSVGGGRGGRQDVQLIKNYEQAVQKSSALISRIDSYLKLPDPKSSIGIQMAQELGVSSIEEANKKKQFQERLIQESLFKKYQLETERGIKQLPPAESTQEPISQPTTKEEYEALPPGTLYIHPSTGKKMRKK